jgi:hypothetical protein
MLIKVLGNRLGNWLFYSADVDNASALSGVAPTARKPLGVMLTAPACTSYCDSVSTCSDALEPD